MSEIECNACNKYLGNKLDDIWPGNYVTSLCYCCRDKHGVNNNKLHYCYPCFYKHRNIFPCKNCLREKKIDTCLQ